MFITFEGGEGSGKSTIVKEVSNYLSKKNIKHIATREPGGSDVAEQIRGIILNKENSEIKATTEALLFAAARIQHLEESILPALKQGKIVVCDRYIDSSLAYQGHARGLGIDKVLQINSFATSFLPKHTFFIDVEPKKGLARAGKRGKLNRLDLEELDFHEKVREGYLILAARYPDRYIIIDGNKELKDVVNDVLTEIEYLIQSL